MEVKKTTFSRKPLSDCTNTTTTTAATTSSAVRTTGSSTSTPLFSKPPKKPIKITQTPLHNRPLRSDTSTGSNNAQNLSQASTPLPILSKSSSLSGTGDFEKSKESVVLYSRRRTVEKSKNKGKKIATPFSCPPVERIKKIGDKLNKEGDGISSEVRSIPQPTHRKKRRHSLPEQDALHGLPRDFIEQQRAYFAEIDAFELPEEVVSDTDLD